MSTPAFGVELFQYLPAATIIEEARLAERLGYDSVWLGDAQLLWRELWVMLGAIAVSTERVAIGPSVTNPITRHPSVTAGAIATLQELSGGRARLGIGVGNTSTGMIGAPAAPRARLREYVATVRALCAGAAVPAEQGTMRLVYADPARPVPIYIGTAGRRTLPLAGELGDGVIIGSGTCTPALLAARLAALAVGRARAPAGRPFRVAISVAAAVHPDRARALAAVRPSIPPSLRHTDPSWPVSDAVRAAREAVLAHYRYDEHMSPAVGERFAALIPDAVVSELSLAGTPEECRARAAALFAAGVDEILINPYGVDGAPRAATLEAFAREVIAPLRAGAA
jgi:5,10-methylenetetrahydromethanopterin reductase